MIEPHGHSPIVGQIERTKDDLVELIHQSAHQSAQLALGASIVALAALGLALLSLVVR